VNAATREQIRAERDEQPKRAVAGTNDGKNVGLAQQCWESTGGDPLLALDLALNRLAGRRLSR
jgi:hypothetical protein